MIGGRLRGATALLALPVLLTLSACGGGEAADAPPEIRYGLDLSKPKLLLADRRRIERLDEMEGELGVPLVCFEDDFEAIRTFAPGAAPTTTSPSGTASTSAWARTWPGWRPGSGSRPWPSSSPRSGSIPLAARASRPASCAAG